MSQSKRRWKLLKNVTKFTRRRSSLTHAEEGLLQALSSSSAKTTRVANKSTRRSSLQQDILRKSVALRPQEVEFLNSLVSAEDVSEQDLENVQSVLSKDPLYNSSGKLKEEIQALASSSEPRPRPKLQLQETNEDGPSFRKQVWLEYTPKAISASEPLLAEEEISREEQQEERSPSLLDKLFGKTTIAPKKPQEPRQQESRQPQEEIVVPLLILATHVDDESCAPHVLSPPIMDAFRPHLPYCVQQDNFWLKYSLRRDGASLSSLLECIRGSARTILAVETLDGHVFGCFTSSPWRAGDYYGSGQAFCWKLQQNRLLAGCRTPEEQMELESQLQVYPWSGKNRNVQSLNTTAYLMVGGGGIDKENDEIDDTNNDMTAVDANDKDTDAGAALYLDSTLERGTSESCVTFDCPPLVKGGVFDIANIEVWTLTPVEHVSQAQQLELGRQFVFDHGNFLEA